MTQLIPIFLASLFGSSHCVAMCGGFAVLRAKNENSPFFSAALYHFGRLVSYLFIASILVLTEHSIKDTSFYNQYYPYFGISFGSILLLLGLMYLTTPQLRIPELGIGRGLSKTYPKILKIMPKSPYMFRFFVGLCSTFLPCGWLYIHLGIAATTEYPALAMFIFWLGTLPLLSLWIGFGSLILSKFEKYLPYLRGALLCIAGLSTIAVIYLRPAENKFTHCHQSGISIADR